MGSTTSARRFRGATGQPDEVADRRRTGRATAPGTSANVGDQAHTDSVSGPPSPNADDAHESADGVSTPGSEPDQPGAADDDPIPFDLTIPDDAAALEADRQAFLDEQARGIGREQGPDWSVREPAPGLPRIFQTRRWQRYGLSGPLVVAVLVAVAVVGSLMTVLRPDVNSTPTPLPLSEPAAGAAPATVGGLMPEAQVSLDGVPLALRRLRPAVLIVAPPSCSTCSDIVADVSTQALSLQLRTLVVGTSDQTDQLRTLAAAAAQDSAGVIVDDEGALTTLFPGPGPTLLLVHADGIVAEVIRDPLTTARIGPALAQLPRPGAGTPTR